MDTEPAKPRSPIKAPPQRQAGESGYEGLYREVARMAMFFAIAGALLVLAVME